MSNSESAYKLRKRIKELEKQNADLLKYKYAFLDIFTSACDAADQNKFVRTGFILSLAKGLMK